MTRYTNHLERWKNCQDCNLCKQRRKVVLFRGAKIPCDVLFVGEAPGFGEDTIGHPFVGPAGRLLDGIIKEAWEDSAYSWGFTNLIACIPKDDLQKKITQPPDFAIHACSDRLTEIINICSPGLVVAVGSVANERLEGFIPDNFTHITHPAALFRANVAQKGLMIQKAIVTLKDALAEIVPF